MSAASTRLPVPGPAFGAYPQRQATPPRSWQRWLGGGQLQAVPASPRGFEARVRHAQMALPPAGSSDFKALLPVLRAELGLAGLAGPLLEQAFAVVLSSCQASLGLQLYDTQLRAARILLDNRLAEMATGEGKTHAAMLAAAVAALAGVPVHVVTANPYLAQRDAQALAPLYAALGLRVAAVMPGQDEAERRAAWAADVAYTTARELIFDYLRDQQAAAQPLHDAKHGASPDPVAAAQARPPLLRGLCMALIDEADAVLIDEARTPFILAQARQDQAAQRRWRAAMAAARRLRPDTHFGLRRVPPRATLNAIGRAACPADAGPTRDPLWRHDHHRSELIETALAALHLCLRDVHYLVTEDKVELIDAGSGRVSPGRRWSAGLHQMVELKEGVTLSAPQHTAAQLSFQRFFPRYWRLCGTSGTLSESGAELLSVYSLHVQRVPLRLPSQRQTLAQHVWASDASRWQAVLQAVLRAHGSRRPVLLGCDSLADADHISALLQSQGLQHQRLDARQDAEEAACVAQAGQSGAITVATRLAGRGTDIRLGQGVPELGGLLVIDCQANGSARIDRQLHGRCARGGEPGQVLRQQSLQSALFEQELPAWLLRRMRQWAQQRLDQQLPPRVAALLRRWLQSRVQARERRQRALLLQHDIDMNQQLGFGGRFE